MKALARKPVAIMEGEDNLDDETEQVSRVPVSLDVIYERLDRELRLRDCCLIATPQPRGSVLEEPNWWVFSAEIQDGGKVKKVDLVKLAQELGCIGETESPIPTWSSPPR